MIASPRKNSNDYSHKLLGLTAKRPACNMGFGWTVSLTRISMFWRDLPMPLLAFEIQRTKRRLG